MAYDLKLADLALMDRSESDAALVELERKAAAPRNGQQAIIDARIRDFEIRYEISSRELLERLAEGAMKETADIVRWLNLLDARENRVRCG